MDKHLNVWKLYHLLSKTKENAVEHIKKNSEWPLEWKTTYYKSYPRLETTKLPLKEMKGDLFSALYNRSSVWPEKRLPIPTAKLSTLLKYACGTTTQLQHTDERLRRSYPSAGARYPIETYILLLPQEKESLLSPGLYHYNIKKHGLTLLLKKEFEDKEIQNLFTNIPIENISAFIILTSVFERTQMKYGARGYRYTLLEAGHISQSLSLLSENLNLTCTVLGGSPIDSTIEKLLDIDGISESFTLALALGESSDEK